MATNDTVQRMLERFQSNYSKHPKWAADNVATWTHGLKRYPDKVVVMAAKRWISEHTRAPNVANIAGIIQGFPTNGEAETAPACKHCGFTGKIEIAHHLSDPDGGNAYCRTYLAACDCPAGSRLAQGGYQPWRVFVDACRANPWTLFVYHSDSDAPFLPEAHRLSAIELSEREARTRANL